ncbi:unnamed protein product [Schistocephalus solidus]|uniref:DUF5917 domain-containing protein n=1 Tax=Schistocephalus solidus TaxID=70667 RepID=A0A183SMZ8_SCHSO|nr:unnamed protein product [Schistocephalus solidus]
MAFPNRYVNNVEFEYVQHSEATSGGATSCEDWFLSAAHFLSLTSWYMPTGCLASLGQNGSTMLKMQSSGAADATVAGDAFFTPPLREAYSRIIGKATSTSCWTCDYSSRLNEPDSPKFPWIATNASESAAPLPDGRLHLDNSLFAPKPPVRRAVEDKILDKYNLGKSESSLYQLSYLDSSSEEEELASSHPSTATAATMTSHKIVSSDDTTEAFSSPDLSAGSLSSPIRISHSLFSVELAEIRTLLEEDTISGAQGGLDQTSLVSDFIRILQKSQSATTTGASALPYPPVDPFFMQLLESQLTMETSCVTAVASSTLNEGDEQEDAMVETPLAPSPDDVIAAAEVEDQRGLLDLSLVSVNRTVGGGLGPFLSALLGRLDCMDKNCLYTNLLLTDVLLTLVSYPQSPLAEFLLNNSVVQLKPPARSFFQVLTGVRKKLQEVAAKLENWKGLVEDARDYLRAFEINTSPVGQRSTVSKQSANAGFAISEQATEDDLLIISNFTNEKGEPTPVFGRLPASPHPTTMHQANPPNLRPPLPAEGRQSRLLEPVVPVHPVECSQPSPQTTVRKRHSSFGRLSNLLHASHHYINSPLSSPQISRRSTSVGPTVGSETRNLVYAFIVLDEFCLELACVCCEQGVFYGRALPKMERTLSLENCLANI